MNMKQNKHRFRFPLTLKISLLIITISLLVTGAVSLTNYSQYLDAVYTIYSDFAQNAGTEILSLVPVETWREYIGIVDDFHNDVIGEEELTAAGESEEYRDSYSKIQSIVDSHGFNTISVFTIDRALMDEPMEENFDPEESYYITYLMDFYPSESDPSDLCPFGESVIWWDDYEGFATYRDIFTSMLETGQGWRLTENLASGKVLLTDYYPIQDGGEVIAVIMLCDDAVQIDDFMNSFFTRSLFIALGITLLLTLISVLALIFRVVRPLQIIRRDAEEFIGKKAAISDRLDKIKTHDEIQALASSFLQMETDIRSYIDQVQAITAEKERIHTELQLATQIQTDMLPTVFPPFPDRREFSVYASMTPAKEVGGDFYDFFFVDDNHLALVIADVSGKGVPAALFMTIAKTLIKHRAQMGGGPSEILGDVNTQLCSENVQGMFVTVWMAIIDLTTGEGVAANAGHEHPIRRDAGGSYELVKYRHSVPVAAMEGVRFREHTFKLNPGDRLFVYTDGVPEAINTSGEEYGTDRLVQLLNTSGDLPFENLLKKVFADVEHFAGEQPQFDDLTMMVFDYFGKEM